jgi:SAM-dependent methyltransferase
MTLSDPIGEAILDFAATRKPNDIIVSSELCEDDIIPLEVLFRSQKDMPELELHALKLCRGDILDVGAGAGVHCTALQNKGMNVFAIESSAGATKHLKNINIPVDNVLFENFKPNRKFDTILMLMNGIGIAGTLGQLKATLLHAKSLLKSGGQLLCDSSDIRYLYEDDDGATWMNLNAEYYGNFRFQMHYKKTSGPWFDWLYVDYDSLHIIANKVGFSCKRISEQEHHFLAQLSID